MVSNLISIVFTPGQIGWIVVLCVVVAAIIAVNIAILFYLRKLRVRKLCTHQLQRKREELLANLERLKNGELVYDNETNIVLGASIGAVTSDDDELADAVSDVDEADDADDTDDDIEKSIVTEEIEADPETAIDAEILAVREMSAATRELLGYVGEQYDRKQFYVRYHMGFEAKLRESDETVKQFYVALANEIGQYKGVKIRESFRQQRVYKGHKTLALIMFRGKTLCIAFALNPNDYVDNKYRGIDKSDKKRFAKTPMLFKITSNRRLEYAKYLLAQLADANTIILDEHYKEKEFDLSEKTRDEMFAAKKLRIAILGEAPELDTDVDDSDEESGEIIEETTIGSNVTEKTVRRVLYNRSFTAKVIQANDDLKGRYSELKNYILSYEGVTEKSTWKTEVFKLRNRNIAAFAISGKTLCLFFALEPEGFEGTKYAVENMTGRRNSGNTPAMYRIKGDRRTKYAKELIDMLMTAFEVERTSRKPVDYTTPYKSTAALVRRGLIKQTETDRALPNFKSSSDDNAPQDVPSAD